MYFRTHPSSFHKSCDAANQEVENFEDGDDADTQTQTHQTADVGEDVEDAVLRQLRDVRVLDGDRVDVQAQHPSSY